MPVGVNEDAIRSTRQRNGIHEPNPLLAILSDGTLCTNGTVKWRENGNSCTFVRLAHVIGDGVQPREFVTSPCPFFRFAPGNEHLASGTEVARGEARGQSFRLLR